MENMDAFIRSHLLLILTQLSFSGWHIVASIIFINHSTNPLIFALYREVFASLMMFLFVSVRKIEILLDPEDYFRVLYLGFCSFVNVVGTVFCLQFITASRYALMQPCIPVISSILSMTLGIESFSCYKILGILLAVIGAVVIELLSSSGSFERNVPLGILLNILQVSAVANIMVFQKSLLCKYDSAVLTFCYYTIGTILTILISLIFLPFVSIDEFLFHSTLEPWIALIYVTLFSTFFAYNAISWSGKYLKPSVIATYCSLQPFFTVILSFIFLHQPVSGIQILGGLLIISGLFITVFSYKIKFPSHFSFFKIANYLTDDKGTLLPGDDAINT